MSKKIGLLVAVIFILGTFAVPAGQYAYAKEYKIAYADFAKIFDDYKKTKDAQKGLEEKGKAKASEEKVLVDELRKLKDEQAMLSEKAKAEKQKVIEVKIKNLQDFRKKAQDDLLKERDDVLRGIFVEIDKVVKAYAKESGYDYILNSRMLLYGNEQSDVTNDISVRLNK